MKTSYIVALSVITSVVMSCNSGIDQNANQNTPSTPAVSLTNSPATNAAVQVNPSNSTKPVLTPTPATSDKPAINPAHGQPGHNCEIAVGAPIPAAATKNILPGNQVTAAPVNVQPQNPVLPTPAIKATPGLNPAHGQPGHRCEISVGAPLKQ